MGDNSKIQWTDATWNPLVGCERVSEGCDHCYAARQASGRLKNVPVYEGLAENGVFTGEIRLIPNRLTQPLHWKRPRRIFVNSMSDLFHPDVTEYFRLELFDVMASCGDHIFQLLTKRPKEMALFTRRLSWNLDGIEFPPYLVPSDPIDRMHADPFHHCELPLDNVWLGTSIELDKYAFRANHLREANAAVRFLSCEPLLGHLPSLDLTDIDWVIVGCESGPNRRWLPNDAVRALRDKCAEVNVPFFVKQLHGPNRVVLHDLEQFPKDLRIREYPGDAK